jgi:ABC-type multidrug transport system fused ATPase/permease subunit
MKVTVLGPSGSGKSTFLSLLPRIYELPENQGSICLDGQDVRMLRLADLRQAVVLVPQQALLFEGTIMSNILYARPKALVLTHFFSCPVAGRFRNPGYIR